MTLNIPPSPLAWNLRKGQSVNIATPEGNIETVVTEIEADRTGISFTGAQEITWIKQGDGAVELTEYVALSVSEPMQDGNGYYVHAEYHISKNCVIGRKKRN